MEDFSTTAIDEEFNKLLPKLLTGTIYGKKVTPYDIKALVVASYFLGQLDGNKKLSAGMLYQNRTELWEE